jgi:hypothetical protein
LKPQPEKRGKTFPFCGLRSVVILEKREVDLGRQENPPFTVIAIAVREK